MKMKNIQIVNVNAQVGKRVKVDANMTEVTPGRVNRLFFELFGELDREVFVIFQLNKSNVITAYEVVSKGTLNSSLVSVRESLKSVILNNCNKIILCHNHPSLHSDPSNEDKVITNRLYEACRMLDITIVDHIIVGKDAFSFRENYLLREDDKLDYMMRKNQDKMHSKNRFVKEIEVRQVTDRQERNVFYNRIRNPFDAFKEIVAVEEFDTNEKIYAVMCMGTKTEINAINFYTSDEVSDYETFRKKLLEEATIANALTMILVSGKGDDTNIRFTREETILRRKLIEDTKIFGIQMVDNIKTDSNVYYSAKENHEM